MLSASPDDRLGVTIAPTDVRIHPRPSDPYRWNILPTRAHLFQKTLSKLSAGIYSQIIEGIGTFIEAVPVSERGELIGMSTEEVAVHAVGPTNDVCRCPGCEDIMQGLMRRDCQPGSTSFADRIAALEEEAASARQSASYWQQSAEREARDKQSLQTTLVEASCKSDALYRQSRKSHQRSRKLSSMANELRSRLMVSKQCLDQLVLWSDRVKAISSCPLKESNPSEPYYESVEEVTP